MKPFEIWLDIVLIAAVLWAVIYFDSFYPFLGLVLSPSAHR